MSRFQNPNRLARAASVGAALLLGLSYGAAMAEGTRATTQEKRVNAPATLKTATQDARASKLIGQDVRDVAGKDIGEIQDLVVDVTNSRVQYVVLSFGGMMGVGDKLFAFPVSALQNPTHKGDPVLQVTKATGFDRAKWPDFGDKTYRQQIDDYFGAGRATAPQVVPGQMLVRASKLMDKDVNDLNGKDAGEIEDIVVDLASAKVRYVVVDFDKAWSPDDKLLALPLRAFNFPTKTDEDLVLNVSRDKLEMARGFDENAWPDINEAGWRRDLDSYIESFPSAAGTPTQQQPQRQDEMRR